MAKEVRLEGSPYWYGTPLDELDFEWSPEEKLELERYCERILKNVAAEEMTPKQRLEATLDGKARDRLLLEALYFNPYAVRTLDPTGDALKPVDVCRDPKLLVKAHLATIGWTKSIMALRRDKELCRRAMDLATEWVIRVGQAMIDMGAQCIVMCSYPRAIPIRGNEWMLEDYTGIGKALGSQVPFWYALTCQQALRWFPMMYEKGALGSKSFRGWFCAEMDYKEVIDFSREHDLYCSCALSDSVLLNGPISAIEEGIKLRCEYGKSHPKFAIGMAAVGYTTPVSRFEAAIAAAKKYGKIS